jgi:hypothetical protein
MRLIRLIHPSDYDARTNDFKSTAFRQSSTGGISVVERECIDRHGHSVCHHARRFYPKYAPCPEHPTIFWELAAAEKLPPGWEYRREVTPTGDDCHGNILGVRNNVARRILKSAAVPDDFMICVGEDPPRRLNQQDLQNIAGQ